MENAHPHVHAYSCVHKIDICRCLEPPYIYIYLLN